MNDTLLTQQCFIDGICGQQTTVLDLISSSSANERFDIYRNTIFENLINALKITFPGVWKLIGDDCAKSVAKAYCKIKFNLPRTGCLDDYGENFPKFLATIPELRTVPYIADYAMYEWLKHIACNTDMIANEEHVELSHIQISNPQDISFTITPCCQLFSSMFAINQIEQVVDQVVLNTVNLSNVGVFGVIHFHDAKLLTYWIDKDLWCFIKSLQNGLTLYESAEQALMADEKFDLTKAIVFIFRNQLIQTIHYNRRESR